MRILLAFIILVVSLSLQAQILPDSISIKEQKLRYQLYQGTMPIGTNRIQVMMKDCDFGLKNYKRGKQMESIGILFTAIGVVATGATLGNHYYNGKTDNPNGILIPSVIMLGAGIPIYFSGRKRVFTGVAFYNRNCAGR